MPSDRGVFDWDEQNLDHIGRHHLNPADVEEALADPRRIQSPAQRGEEPRRAVIGATESGQLLFMVYTVRAGHIRLVTARDAVRWERRRYETKGK